MLQEFIERVVRESEAWSCRGRGYSSGAVEVVSVPSNGGVGQAVNCWDTRRPSHLDVFVHVELVGSEDFFLEVRQRCAPLPFYAAHVHARDMGDAIASFLIVQIPGAHDNHAARDSACEDGYADAERSDQGRDEALREVVILRNKIVAVKAERVSSATTSPSGDMTFV